MKTLVRELCQFPHRATGADWQEDIFNVLSGYFSGREEVQSVRQEFRSPPHFIQIIALISIGIGPLFVLAGFYPGWRLLWLMLQLLISVGGLLYLDWRYSPAVSLGRQIDTANLIIKRKSKHNKEARKIVLMAHWDTAPITLPYREDQISRLPATMAIGRMLLLAAPALVLFYTEILQTNLWIGIAILVLYTLFFGSQPLVLWTDFRKHGYSNGANDNATGCAVALEIARTVWEQGRDDLELEVCINGAEEVGMLGAREYLNQHPEPDKLTVINFDTLGFEKLQVITSTKALTRVRYDSNLLEAARRTAVGHIHFGVYKTANVDSVWFARKGIPSLTYISHQPDGSMTGIHRPGDRPDAIYWDTVEQAYRSGLALVESLGEEAGHSLSDA